MKRTKICACVLIAALLTFGLASMAAAQTWIVTTIDATGNTGRHADLQVDAAGNLHVVYLRYDTNAFLYIARLAGTWQSPATIDGPGGVAGAGSLSLDPSDVPRAAYYGSTLGALRFAGPERAREWSRQTIASTGDVGRSLRKFVHPSGEIGVAYRNATNQSLELIVYQGGVWGTPTVVDPGPNRGTNCDLTYRPGIGYAFSEYASDVGALILADPVLRARSWSVGQAVASPDNVGTQLKLHQSPAGEMAIAYRNATRGSLLYTRFEGGAWTSPVTVDPGPNRGSSCDLTLRPGIGYAFSEYAGDAGSLLLADPVLRARPWSTTALTSSEDDLGRGLSLLVTEEGNLAAAFRNATQGSLVHMRQDGETWTAPVTVDVGPGRGASCDLVELDGPEFAFSEYDSRDGSLFIAHPEIAARPWDVWRVDAVPDVGRQLALHQGATGRLDCAFLKRDATDKMQLCVMEMIPGSAFVIRTIADSVSLSSAGHVEPDLFVTADRAWSVSYRNAVTQDLCLASTDSFQVEPADAPDAPGEEAPDPIVLTALSKTYPNPTWAGLRIRYTSAIDTEGSLEIFDIEGRSVCRTPLRCKRGENLHLFDGRNDAGSPIGPGVYFLKLRVGDTILGPRKIILMGGDRTDR